MSFETIYRVFYRSPTDDYNTVKQLGIYESQEAAEKAISMTLKGRGSHGRSWEVRAYATNLEYDVVYENNERDYYGA